MSAFAAAPAFSTRPITVTSLCSRSPSLPSRPARVARPHTPSMVVSDQDTKPLRITGNNIQITDSMRAYVNDKLSKILRRFPTVVSKLEVHLTVEQNPSVPNRHKAEVIAFSGKTILRTEVRDEDMYTAIDSVEERIARTIRKFKERREAKGGKSKEAASGVEDQVFDEEEDGGDYVDTYGDSASFIPAVTDIVRRKVFPMPLQTVEEAVLCCEYVDHPWYLFRNAATEQISLVYKRNHGGYGLIEPSNPDIIDNEPV